MNGHNMPSVSPTAKMMPPNPKNITLPQHIPNDFPTDALPLISGLKKIYNSVKLMLKCCKAFYCKANANMLLYTG